jgi:hypothetical protein
MGREDMIIRDLRPLYDTKGNEYNITNHVYGNNEYYILNDRIKISRVELELAFNEKRIKQ